MNKKQRAVIIRKTLDKLYPTTTIPLDHDDHYTLLIAVLLSAQCTDKQVNKITPHLFKKAKTPSQMIALGVDKIQEIIRPCGLSGKKSSAIFELSKILLEKHQGIVPNTFEDLEHLPGVGHKTASVVMAQAFHIPAFPIDTHIHRCAKRWGLSLSKNVTETETDLKKLFPKNSWIKLHLQIIFFAREYCQARGHIASNCPICSLF